MSKADRKNARENGPPDPFIKYLEENRDNRAVMASLRRGLAQPGCAEVSRIVQHWLPLGSRGWREDAYYTIAPLFALHHKDIAIEGNMGDHFRALCDNPSDPPPSVERRFMQLLASDAVDLDDLLRQAVSLLKSKDMAVNWQGLLEDVRWWKHSDKSRDRVRLEWSRSFWRTSRQPAPPLNKGAELQKEDS